MNARIRKKVHKQFADFLKYKRNYFVSNKKRRKEAISELKELVRNAWEDFHSR